MDPIPTRELADNFNRYWYANNNPYKFVDPNGEDSFLASRPTKVFGGASHNYIATNARYVGDPNATIHSYGNRGNDMAGKVNSATPGMSEGTYVADKEHWASLSLDLAAKNASKIDAPDDVVDQIADSVSPTVPYSPTPGLTPANDINSNSIASAVADKAAGKEVPINQESRISPGKDEKHLVEFKDPIK